jgi:hypothetical protein
MTHDLQLGLADLPRLHPTFPEVHDEGGLVIHRLVGARSWACGTYLTRGGLLLRQG